MSKRTPGEASASRWLIGRLWRVQASARFRAAAATLCVASLVSAGVGILDVGTAGAMGGARPPAVAKLARTVSLSESGRLRLTSKKGFTLNERGTASGTIAGSIYIHLHLVSQTKVTAEVNIYPRGGSLTGSGSASYHVIGGYAVFSGTLSITRGTGKYARARASGLRFTGTIQRRDDSVSVHLSGSLSY